MKKGIEFADETWNPVWGCENSCPYCFAKQIAKRFGEQTAIKEAKYLSNGNWPVCHEYIDRLKNFIPTFLHSHLEKKFKKSSTHIFVNSMSDIMYWDLSWYLLVQTFIEQQPDKKFIFFTKDLKFSSETVRYIAEQGLPNCYLVFTVNNRDQFVDYCKYAHKKFGLCIEPMQSEFLKYDVYMIEEQCNYLIIGSETGNRKWKVQVERKWIEPFYDTYIPVFMKESIRTIVPNDKFRQERI